MKAKQRSFYLLADRVDDLCEMHSECERILKEKELVCSDCGLLLTCGPIDVALYETPACTQVLSGISGLTGIGLIHDKLLMQLGDVTKYLHLGSVFWDGPKRLANWSTFVGKKTHIVRGVDYASYRHCTECGGVHYYSRDQTFLFPAPTVPISVSKRSDLIVDQNFYDTLDLAAPAWRTVRIRRLEIPEVPPDGYTELSSEVACKKAQGFVISSGKAKVVGRNADAATRGRLSTKMRQQPERTPSEQLAYNEALKRIDASRRAGSAGTGLDLSDLGLTDLPPQIWQLSALNELDLGSNQLSSLPPEIGELKALSRLCVFGNQLLGLPPEIGQLSALSHLDLTSNLLMELPAEIGQLSALSELYLMTNQLCRLPSQIRHLTALTNLILSGNELPELIPEIGCLTRLQELDLGGNQLTSLPIEIGNLRSLSEFNVSDNQLTGLPTEIGNLHNLKTLDLGGNRLKKILPEVCRLRSLRRLAVRDNLLNSLPPELNELSGLKEIVLYGNKIKIKSLPKKIQSAVTMQFDLAGLVGGE